MKPASDWDAIIIALVVVSSTRSSTREESLARATPCLDRPPRSYRPPPRLRARARSLLSRRFDRRRCSSPWRFPRASRASRWFARLRSNPTRRRLAFAGILRRTRPRCYHRTPRCRRLSRVDNRRARFDRRA